MRKVAFLLLVAALTAFLFWTAPGHAALAKMGEWLEVQTPLGHVDLIVALGGDRSRQEKGVELYRRGIGRYLLFTGADSRERDYACLGVPAAAALPTSQSAFTTGDEAVAARDAVERNHLRSILIVTSPYHSRRALAAFRRAFRGRSIEIELAVCENPPFLRQPWWKSHMGQKTVTTEYLGMGYYWLRGAL